VKNHTGSLNQRCIQEGPVVCGRISLLIFPAIDRFVAESILRNRRAVQNTMLGCLHRYSYLAVVIKNFIRFYKRVESYVM